MSQSNRRVFLMQVAVAGTGLAAARAHAAPLPDLAEADPAAKALGYVANAAASKPGGKFAAGQMCSNCALFQGKAADAAGGCPLFTGKQVKGTGWCTAYNKKPA
jgi:hypothetical protein